MTNDHGQSNCISLVTTASKLASKARQCKVNCSAPPDTGRFEANEPVGGATGYS